MTLTLQLKTIVLEQISSDHFMLHQRIERMKLELSRQQILFRSSTNQLDQDGKCVRNFLQISRKLKVFKY